MNYTKPQCSIILFIQLHNLRLKDRRLLQKILMCALFLTALNQSS